MLAWNVESCPAVKDWRGLATNGLTGIEDRSGGCLGERKLDSVDKALKEMQMDYHTYFVRKTEKWLECAIHHDKIDNPLHASRLHGRAINQCGRRLRFVD